MTFIITDRPARTAWQQFVSSHPGGNIFQTPEFADVVAGVRGWSSRTLAAVDANGEIAALWPAVLTTVLGGLLRPLATRDRKSTRLNSSH